MCYSSVQDELAYEANPVLLTTNYYYHTYDNSIKITDPQGNTTTTYYDGIGRVYTTLIKYLKYY